MTELMNHAHEIATQFWGLWLMLMFLGVVWFAYNPKRKNEMHAHARIPLDDDKPLTTSIRKDA